MSDAVSRIANAVRSAADDVADASSPLIDDNAKLRGLLDRLCRINYKMTPEAAAVISNSVIADYLALKNGSSQ